MKRLLVLGLLVTSLGVQIACGDDKQQVVYVVPDGGTTPTNPVCDPKDNTPQTQFNVVPVFQGRCIDDQIISILTDCANGPSTDDCTATREKYSACASCMIGAPTDPDAHPIYEYDPNSSLDVSIGACMLLFAHSDDELKCAQAFGQVEVCSFAACVPACVADEKNQDYATHFDSCLTAVGGANCTKGYSDYASPACASLYQGDGTSNAYGFCTTRKQADGTDISVEQYFFDVAVLTCGSRDTDGGIEAGTTDSGADAGDAGDADIKDAATDG